MDIECPYCHHEMDVCTDDGFGCEEGRVYEMECEGCEKGFVFTTSIHFYYEPKKADCLNGAAHDYKRTKTFPPEYAVVRCTTCGNEKPLPAPDAAGGEREER